MNGNLRRWAAAAVVLALLALGPGPEAAEEGQATFRVLELKGKRALENWQYPEARGLAEELTKIADEEGAPPELKARAHLFQANYNFYAGDYAAAKPELEAAQSVRSLDESGAAFLKRVTVLTETWQDQEETDSAHFRVRVSPGPDRVLAEPVLAALEKAYAVLSVEIGVEPAPPILVEIYPDFTAFSSAVGLSEKDLEESGTIAICKYRRLMLNSPRNLARGYSYLDTAAHELVHFMIYQRFGEGVSIWLHEGLAKYEEFRWRGEKGGWLQPSMKSLLASGLRQGELIGFERMSPSFAYFDDPRQGQLAFAEVSTVVDYLVKKVGWEGIFSLCRELAQGTDDRAAVRKVTGVPFDRFWAEWVSYARTKGYQELPGMEITAYQIRKDDSTFDEEDEQVSESDLAGGEEWRYVRLGDLLRDRGHYPAALVEYRQARELAPHSLRVLNKIGLTCFLAGDYQGGLADLRHAVELYPDFSTTYINLGRTLFFGNQKPEAEQMLLKALEINPFNPIAYGFLFKIYQDRGDEDRAKKIAGDLALISQ